MGAYNLTNTMLKVNNTKYYRSNGIRLGDVGTKKTSVFSVNRVDAQSNIPAPKMKVKTGEPLAMTSKFASEISARFSYNGINGSMFRDQLTKGDLKIVRYYMQPRDMENAIEHSPKLIETIRSIGRDARVVSEVWLVVDAKVYEKTKGGGKLNYQFSGSGKTTIERETTVTIGDDTVFAYMLEKIDWKEKQKKNWKTIEKFNQDQKGL